MIIRPAIPADAYPVAELILSAGPEVYDFLYTTPKHAALDFIRHEFQSGRGYGRYQNAIVVEHNGRVVGAACSFDGTQRTRLMLGSVINMVLFYGPLHVWRVLSRADQVTSIMHTPQGSEVYMTEVAVLPDWRGQGIGARIMQARMEQAGAAGYRKISLSVAENNPKAERFYERLGFQFVKRKVFKGLASGDATVPNARRMERAL